jgi:hypothetical protein
MQNKEGAPGFEPGTSRSAVECSTTELYPHISQPTFSTTGTNNKTENIIRITKFILISKTFTI